MWHGLHRARVLVRVDTDKQHRIKVDCPVVYGSLAADQLPWAYPIGMPAEAASPDSPFDGAGEMHVPLVGQPVWVMFEGGDANFPVWFQGWWANSHLSKSHPPSHAFDANGNPDNRYFTTPRGTTVQLDDREGSEKILLLTPEGDYVVVDVQGRSVDIWSEANTRVRSPTQVEVQAPTIICRGTTINIVADGDISFAAGGKINLVAEGDINVAGANVNAVAAAELNASGVAGAALTSGGTVALGGASGVTSETIISPGAAPGPATPPDAVTAEIDTEPHQDGN